MPLPIIGEQLYVLAKVDSTNTYAATQCKAGKASCGSVYFTHEQTQGRGQKGRKWVSEKSKNLLFSFVLDIETLPADKIFHLMQMASLGVYDYVSYHLTQRADIKIKWVNDIYVGDKKIAGILIDKIRVAQRKTAIIGIGCNLNQRDFSELPQHSVTSLCLEKQRSFTLLEELQYLLIFLQNRYEQLYRHSFSVLHEAYNAALYQKNKYIQMQSAGGLQTFLVKYIDPQGYLVAERGGVEKRYFYNHLE